MYLSSLSFSHLCACVLGSHCRLINLYYDGWAIPNRPFPFLCHPCDSINMVMPVRRFLPVFTFLATHSGPLQSHPTPDPAGALITAPGHAVVSYLAPGTGGPVGQLWRCWRGHFSKSGSKWEWHPAKEAYNGLFFFFLTKVIVSQLHAALCATRAPLEKCSVDLCSQGRVYAASVVMSRCQSVLITHTPLKSRTLEWLFAWKVNNCWL